VVSLQQGRGARKSQQAIPCGSIILRARKRKFSRKVLARAARTKSNHGPVIRYLIPHAPEPTSSAAKRKHLTVSKRAVKRKIILNQATRTTPSGHVPYVWQTTASASRRCQPSSARCERPEDSGSSPRDSTYVTAELRAVIVFSLQGARQPGAWPVEDKCPVVWRLVRLEPKKNSPASTHPRGGEPRRKSNMAKPRAWPHQSRRHGHLLDSSSIQEPPANEEVSSRTLWQAFTKNPKAVAVQTSEYAPYGSTT